jgi:peptidyl-prolyl cis-trans isomerase D
MIRLLQKDNRAVKVMFAVIIGAAILSMIVYLVPGLTDSISTDGTDVIATVHRPGAWGRLFGESIPIKTLEVSKLAQQMIQQQGYPAQYAQLLMPQMEQQARQVRIAWAIEELEVQRLGLVVTDADVRAVLHEGQLGQILFPNGQYIGDDKYRELVQNQIGLPSTAEFEKTIKNDLGRQRLREYVTAGVRVSDNAVREAYRLEGTKVKIDYAVVTPDDVKKNVTTTDSELQKFFNDNKARYANAVPEMRKIIYVAVTPDTVPGGKPQVTDADVQKYYNEHAAQYKVEEQAKVRHILIQVPPGADAKTDAAAKAKAQDILNKIHSGGDFAALAKENSDDPGSKVNGGDLGLVKKNGQMVPEFETAAFNLKVGQTSGLVKTQFGYHIIQVTERQDAHTKPVAEVAGEIRPLLEQQKAQQGEQAFATGLANEAAKQGLAAAAGAHHLQAQTTDYIPQSGVVAGVTDSTQLLSSAFGVKKGDTPKAVATGEGMAVFQVVDVQPAHAPTFEQWKGHIADDYTQEQVPAMMQAKLAKLADRAKQLNDLKKAGAELNVTVKSSDLVGRDGNVPDLGLMTGSGGVAFTLAKGAVSQPIDTGRAGAVLQVVDKQEPTTDEIVKNMDKTRDALLQQKQSEVFGLYMGTLLDVYMKKGGVRMTRPTQQKGQAPQNPLGM